MNIIAALNNKSYQPVVANYYLATSALSYQVFITDYLVETLTNIQPMNVQEIKSDVAKKAILADLKTKYKEYLNKIGLNPSLIWNQSQDLTELDVKSISELDPLLIASFPSVDQVMKGLNEGTIMPTTTNFKIIKLINPQKSPYYLISTQLMLQGKKGIDRFKVEYASQPKWHSQATYRVTEPISNFPNVKQKCKK